MRIRNALITGTVGLALAAGLIALMAACGASDGGEVAPVSRDPVISGNVLAAYDPRFPDNEIGRPAPEVRGADFDGGAVAIVNDGRPKAVVFLAHWCSHCQVEVPRVQAWLDGDGKPEGVDIYSVATSIDELRSNYPPEDWLYREGWTAPVLVDTNDTVLNAFGLTAFPFWVFIDSDGTIVRRISGEVQEHELTPLFDEIR